MAFTNERHLVLGVALECALVAHSVICSVRFAEGEVEEAKNNRVGSAESSVSTRREINSSFGCADNET